jgi:hypothetical protein
MHLQSSEMKPESPEVDYSHFENSSDVGSEEAAAFLTSQREALQEEPQDEIDEMELLLGEAI